MKSTFSLLFPISKNAAPKHTRSYLDVIQLCYEFQVKDPPFLFMAALGTCIIFPFRPKITQLPLEVGRPCDAPNP